MKQKRTERRVWQRTAIFILTPLPMIIAILNYFGIAMSEGVWALHVLIGIGLVLTAGVLSLAGSSRYPIYSWYAVGFFIAAFLLWYIWLIADGLAYAISAALSGFATFLVYIVWSDEKK